MVDIKEREAMKLRRDMYRHELEKQAQEMNNRIKASKHAALEEERNLLARQLGSVRESQDTEIQSKSQKKAIAMRMMNENMKLRSMALEQTKETERRENMEMMQRIKEAQEEEKIKREIERQNRMRIADALKMAYIMQEKIKKQEDEKLKELDRMYSEKHKEKLLQDEKYRQRVT